MRRLVAVVVLAACGSAPTAEPPPAQAPPPVSTPDPAARNARITALAQAELVTLHAVTAADLVPGARPRALTAGPFATLPYSHGNAGWVPLLLAPATLRVPTELGLRISYATDPSGQLVVTERPSRADLVAATSLALAGDEHALAVASDALTAAGIHPTPPATTWADAVRVIRLDPRLPAAQLAGPATWQLIFDPADPQHGSHGVLLELPGFRVTLAN